MTEQDDLKLVRRCCRGDAGAFGQLVNKYQKLVFNVALRMLGDRLDAEDVTQTVFVKAFEKIDTFNPDYKFFSWIYRMVVNESLNALNQRKSVRELDEHLVSAEKNPEDQYRDRELGERIQMGLMDLQIEHRVMIVLRHFEELTYKEIGFILDIPEKKVKSRLFTARRLLCGKLTQRGIAAHD